MTTQFKTIGTFPALLLAVTFLATVSAKAHSPRSREMPAVIHSSNHDQRTVSLDCPQRRGPRELVWNSHTQFLRDWKFVPATELKDGIRVTVYYRSPFFGKPFVTKIIWKNQHQPG